MSYIPKISLPLKGVNYLIFIVLVNSIATTMLVPVFPIYTKNFVLNNAYVGYVTAFISLLLILYTILIRKIIPKIGKLNLIRWGFLGAAITQVLLIFLSNIKQFLILELVRTFFLVAVYITIGLFVREYTTLKSIGKAEGQYFTTANIGWLLGPLFGGLLSTNNSFNTVFIVSAIPQLLIALLLFIIPLKESSIHNNHEFKFLDYFKNKELLFLYLIGFGLAAWSSIFYVYMPLFANTSGFSTRLIGFAMVIAIIPLIIFEIPIGKLADIYGYKKFIAFGFLIMALATIFTYFTNPLYTIILLVVAAFGVAFIEHLLEAYFFDRVRTHERQNELYPVYKTSPEISKLISFVLFSTILIYLGFKGLFLFTAIFMLIFAAIALKLKK